MSLSSLYVTLLALILPLSVPASRPFQNEPVRIGLLLPDLSQQEVIAAAERAIAEANKTGGFKGRPFELRTRSTEGPWGAGSKQSVSLVYDDKVWAILGSLDGRNAHLAEQVAAKSHLVYLETNATDPTLSQAYVPWFLRNVPNDNQQAEAILELIGEKGIGKTALLASEAYDARYAAKSLTEQAAKKYGISPLIITVDPIESAIATVIEQVNEAGLDHLVVSFFSEATLKIVSGIKERNPHLKVYGTLAFSAGLESQEINLKSLDGMILIQFYKGTIETRGPNAMGLAASYAYDGINLILQAITQVGLEKESIRDYILQQDHPIGLSGPIKFDEMGNRTGKPQFVRILMGEMVPFNC